MDSKELQGLLEAYTQVHTTQEVDEAVKGASPHTMEMRKGDAADRRKGIKPLSAKKGEEYAKYKMSQMAHSERKRMGEEVEQIDEISANLALTASQKADEVRRKASLAGDKETASKKAAQASRLYAGVGPRRAKERQRVDEATAMAKRGYDEAPIRQKIAKSTGGGEAADRATKLADQPTFGQRGVDPKARQNLARAQKGDFRQTTSSSPGLHGYGYKSDDPAVKAKQAARGAQRGALTPAEKKQLNREEFDTFNYLLEYLVAEGYADTNKAAIAIMANMSEEWKESIILGESALGAGTMAVLAGMSAGRAIHGKLQDRKAKKELEAKRRTSDYLIMKDKTKNIVARDRSASGDTRNEEYVDESQYARENPEKYEREQAKAKSKKQKAMEDPHTGINSPAFEKFMRQQMGR